MSAVLEARAIISAEDRTGAAFASVKARIAELTKQTAAVERVVSVVGAVNGTVVEATTSLERFGAAGRGLTVAAESVAKLRASYAETAVTIEKATAAAQRFGRASKEGAALVGRGAGPGGRTGAGHGFGLTGALIGGAAIGFGIEGVHEAVKASAEQVHERMRMEVAGLSADEMRRSDALTASLSQQLYAAGSRTDMMHMLRNARSVTGDFSDAASIMPDLLRLRVVAQAARPGADVTDDFDQLVKGLEIKGVTQHPEEFHNYMEGIAKGINAFGDTIKPAQYYQMFKYGRQATPMLSEQFILGSAPALAQSLGGSSFGKAVSAFSRANVEGIMKTSAVGEFLRLGLARREDIEFDKAGKPSKFRAGKAPVGWEVAQTDPYRWVKEFLIPGMTAAGIVAPQDVMKEVGGLYQNQLAAQLVGLLATQQPKIEKDMMQVRGAKGLAAADEFASKDPLTALQGLTHAAKDLAAAFSLAAGVAPALNGLSKAAEAAAAYLNGVHARIEAGEPGQPRVNRILNGLRAAATGMPDPETSESADEGYRTSLLKEARGLIKWSAKLPGVADEKGEREKIAQERAESKRLEQEYESTPKPGLFGYLIGRRVDTAPLERSFALRDDANRRETILNAPNAVEELTRAADAFEAARHAIAAYEGALTKFRLPTDLDASVPGGPTAFPLRAGFGATGFGGGPLPSPDHATQWAPPGTEGRHISSAEDLAGLLNGRIVAQLDPNTKVEVTIDNKVEGTSEFFHLISEAKAAASGQASALVGTSGSLGVSYPHANPAGRNGGSRLA